jgi:hypothetical protein
MEAAAEPRARKNNRPELNFRLFLFEIELMALTQELVQDGGKLFGREICSIG